jgi:hypothetical protein
MSFFNVSNQQPSQWKDYEKAALRFFFIYFVILAVPLDWKFYQQLFSINWLHPHFYQLFSLSKYSPQFFGATGYTNWIIAAGIALIGAAAWSFLRPDSDNYDNIHYWLRVILRYRLAIGIIAYGLIKLFPLQMPYPSLSNLHTNYGDFYAWKIYFHTIGITQYYEMFLGFIEILAGALLFVRRTTTFGTAIILGFTGNAFAANLGYDAGEQVYAGYLVVIALFLFVYDVPRLYNLLIEEKYTIAAKFEPVFAEKNLRQARLALRAIFLLFVVSLAFTTYANYTQAPYKYPATPGLKGTYGFYDVKEFRLNGRDIPYSVTDSNRWQNVVFEKWATISIKIAKPLKPDASTGDVYTGNDLERNFESAGVSGRRYYGYKADTLSRTISLQNKNKHYPDERYSLTYSQPNDSTIILKGVNERRDSVYAVLNRINQKHLLFEGRRKPLKL